MKKIVSIYLFFFIFLFLTQSVEAHILKTDENIGAVLHIDPDDDPIAHEQSSFFFEFKDKENKFKPENCDCTFSITEDKKEIYSQSLFQNNTNPSLASASIFYTFPEKNIYQVTIIGKPTSPNAFQPFTLLYDIRVDRESKSLSPDQNSTQRNWFIGHGLHFLLGGVVFICVIIALRKKSKNT